jgi:hypothetical protein
MAVDFSFNVSEVRRFSLMVCSRGIGRTLEQLGVDNMMVWMKEKGGERERGNEPEMQ